MGVGNCPCFSPDDSQMACFVYSADQENVKGGSWIINVDEGTRRWLCEGETNGLVSRWHQAAGRVQNSPVLRRWRVVDVKSGCAANAWSKTRMTCCPAGAWSPNGKKIAFIGFRKYSTHESRSWHCDGRRRACPRVNTGSSAARSACMAASTGRPTASAKLTFTIWQPSEVEHSYTINVAGDHTPQKFENQEPGIKTVEAQWSPDGKRLVFSRDRKHQFRRRFCRSRVRRGSERMMLHGILIIPQCDALPTGGKSISPPSETASRLLDVRQIAAADCRRGSIQFECHRANIVHIGAARNQRKRRVSFLGRLGIDRRH